MVGLGTIINVVAILLGSAIGVALGHRLPMRTREVVTDGMGLVTLLVAALSAAAVLDPALREVVGSGAVLVVLGAVLIGGIVGSLARLEDRLESLGEHLQRLGARRRGRQRPVAEVPESPDPDPGNAAADPVPEDDEHDRALRFVDGFVSASLVFCIGPLAILGALSDGLGLGIDQLALKSILDGFIAIAFAASLGWGVAASALAVGVYQGLWTLLGWAAGDVLADAQVAAITATGGVLLVGVGLRLIRLQTMRVGDLLPALVVAPIIVAVIGAINGS
ncbi:MAG: uncharacterized protein QG597_3893 [Actinomycetota bacterium]|nr:uncharacterized protein [Actinomycetota bacterium]